MLRTIIGQTAEEVAQSATMAFHELETDLRPYIVTAVPTTLESTAPIGEQRVGVFTSSPARVRYFQRLIGTDSSAQWREFMQTAVGDPYKYEINNSWDMTNDNESAIVIEQSGSGDASIEFELLNADGTSAQRYTAGIDNSYTGNPFVIWDKSSVATGEPSFRLDVKTLAINLTDDVGGASNRYAEFAMVDSHDSGGIYFDRGLDVSMTVNGTGNRNTVLAIRGLAKAAGAGVRTITNIYGADLYAWASNDNLSLTDLAGVLATADCSAAISSGYLYGVYALADQSKGTTNEIYGVLSDITMSSTGATGSLYGLYVGGWSGTGTRATNAYGLYIDNTIAGITTQYAIYSLSTTPSFLTGNLYVNGNLGRSDDTDLIQMAANAVTVNGSLTATTLNMTGLTASRLVATDASKNLASVADLASWVAGTTNQITITADGDGSITASTPQDIHTAASPTFAGLDLTEGNITNVGNIALDSLTADASIITLNATTLEANPPVLLNYASANTNPTGNTTGRGLKLVNANATAGTWCGFGLDLGDTGGVARTGAQVFAISESKNATQVDAAFGVVVRNMTAAGGFRHGMRITTLGLVGFGTVTPGNRLHIYDNDTDDMTAGDGSTFIIEQDSTGDAAIQFELTAGQIWSMGVDNSQTNDPFTIYDGATERLNINGSTGLVTVGSLDLTEGNITNVGDISLDSITSDGTTITIGTTTTAVFTDGGSLAITLDTGAGDDFTIGSTQFVVEGDTGYVGVGTATPLLNGGITPGNVLTVYGSTYGALELAGNRTTSTACGSMVFVNTAIAAAEKRIAQITAQMTDTVDYNSSELRFYVWKDGTFDQAMTVGADGMVAIGGTAATELLHVSDTTNGMLARFSGLAGSAAVNNATVAITLVSGDHGIVIVALRDHGAATNDGTQLFAVTHKSSAANARVTNIGGDAIATAAAAGDVITFTSTLAGSNHSLVASVLLGN